MASTVDGESLYLKNMHGDVSSTTSIEGAIQNTYIYDAFGNQLNKNTNDTNPFRYCGEYYDEETGQIYLRNRYYDQATGRFITEDPIKDGLNWYSYCDENPVMMVDPWGLAKVSISMEGITLRTLENVEAKYTGMYASLRSIANNTGASVDFKLNDNGSAVVNYSISSSSIGGIYGHRIEIKFDKFREGEYASGVRVFAFGNSGEFEVTTWTEGGDLLATELKRQENYFYLKKDDNNNGLVVNGKVTALFASSNKKNICIYFVGQWELSGIISSGENLDRQYVLDILAGEPMIKVDSTNISDVIEEWRKIYYE